MIAFPYVTGHENIDALPRNGVIGGELQMDGDDGTTLLEFVLPDRFPGGPNVPFKANWWSLDPGNSTPPESHPMHEFWLISRGEAELTMDGRIHRIRAGQAVFIPSQVLHHAVSCGDEPLVGFAVWWDPQ